jgi:hypothetical protein
LQGTTKDSTSPAINIETWSEFLQIETFGEPELEKLVVETAKFILELKSRSTSRPRWLSLVGRNGCGKTMAAKRVWRWWNRGGSQYECPQTGAMLSTPGEFVRWDVLVEELRGLRFGWFSDLKRVPFLVLDEVGGNLSDMLAEKLSELLGARVGRWTLITSNLFGKDFAQIDPRISSRLIRDGNVLLTMKETEDYSIRQWRLTRAAEKAKNATP